MSANSNSDSTPSPQAKKALAITWSTCLGFVLVLATGGAILLPSTKSARVRIPTAEAMEVHDDSGSKPQDIGSVTEDEVALWSSKTMRVRLPANELPDDQFPDNESSVFELPSGKQVPAIAPVRKIEIEVP